jgi:hypothetical protein
MSLRDAAVALAVLSLPAVSTADILIVDYDDFLPQNYSNIQEAVDAASDGDEIQVLSLISLDPVTFTGPGNTDIDFSGKNLTIWASEGPEQTIIDCGGTARAFIVGAGVDSTSVIEGFTIQNGSATDTGGAVLCDGGSPRISGCVFRWNEAPVGAALKFSGGATRVSGCEFYSNSAPDRGGAVCIDDSEVSMSRCTFSNNGSQRGGGIALENSTVVLARCTFGDNTGAFGSSLFLDGAEATIEQCILAFGHSSGAIYGGSPETFHSCVFGNSSGDDLPGNPHDNINEDPLVCDLYGMDGGNLSLCSNSPCLPANNEWTLPIGTKAQGCGECDSPVERSSWGGVKALFR